jgi:hypothetical protein
MSSEQKIEPKKFSRRMWQVLSSANRHGRMESTYIQAATILVRHGFLEVGQRRPDGYHDARPTTAGTEALEFLRK